MLQVLTSLLLAGFLPAPLLLADGLLTGLDGLRRPASATFESASLQASHQGIVGGLHHAGTTLQAGLHDQVHSAQEAPQ